MAGAASKKLQAAKQATVNTYRPILITVNILYLLLAFGMAKTKNSDDKRQLLVLLPYGLWGCLGMVVTWALQYYAFVGILEDAGNNCSKRKNNKSFQSGDLVGGVHLDLLGLTILVQFLTVLHSPKWFLLCTVGVPFYALWKLCTTVYGGSTTNTVNKASSHVPEEEAPKNKAREARRVERRNQRGR